MGLLFWSITFSRLAPLPKCNCSSRIDAKLVRLQIVVVFCSGFFFIQLKNRSSYFFVNRSKTKISDYLTEAKKLSGNECFLWWSWRPFKWSACLDGGSVVSVDASSSSDLSSIPSAQLGKKTNLFLSPSWRGRKTNLISGFQWDSNSDS